MVQWLRRGTPSAGVLDSIPGQGSRAHTLQCSDPAHSSEGQCSQTHEHVKINGFLKREKS